MAASTLTIEIDLGNDAMQTPSDALRAVSYALGRIEDHQGLFQSFQPGDAGIVRDENGNTVGSRKVK